MNSNLFDRKNFLDGNWMTTNISNYFSNNLDNDNLVIKVNLIRATANEADYLKKYLNKFADQELKAIVIDLSECNFVDSTFLSGIISFNKNTDTKVKLVVSDTRQLRIFHITKLDSIFKIYTNIDQAIAS